MSGCVGGTVASIDGPVLISGMTNGDMEALLVGEVMNSDACIKAGSSDSGIAWPAGTTWDSDEKAVVLPDGRRMQDGDSISAGGGESSMNDPNFSLELELDADAQECGF